MKNLLKPINIILLFSFLLFLSGASQAQAGDVLITVNPSVAEVLPGSSFTIEIKVNPNSVVPAPNGVAGIQTNFEFDKDLVQVDANSVTLNSEIVSAGFSSAGSIDNDQGVVSYIFGMPVDYPTLFPDAEFIFATINLTASNSLSGTAYLRLSYLADYTDPLNSLIICDDTLYVEGESGPQPLPYAVTDSSIIITDNIPPADITDFSAGSPTTSSITLTWTAPGDDGATGTASSYDIRYFTSEITEDNWDSATQVENKPIPTEAGNSESVIVSGLDSETTYYFAIKTSDDGTPTGGTPSSNVSGLSNITNKDTSATTPPPPPPPSGGGGGGGGGGVLPPSDITPPGKITDFIASAGDKEIILTWKNPADSDFAGVKILRKEDDYPANTGDGKVVYSGKEEIYTDTELTNNTAYYYAAFTYDSKPNYSKSATASATPAEGKIPEPPPTLDYPDDTLLKSFDDDKIYVITGGEKEWIKTAEEFIAGGYKWEDIKIISKEELDAIPNYGSGGGSPQAPNPPVNPTGYADGTLLKIADSFKVYVVIDQKKKWIATPEVFETLGYAWGNITVISKAELDKIPNYEDNLIRTIGDYKVYLVVNGIKRHVPNPEIFLDYGFSWDDVKDVPSATVDKYKRASLIRESRQGKIYYLDPRGIKKHIPNSEVFDSYNNNWEDIQVISKKEMDSYPESNLARLAGDNRIYLIENGTVKRWIPTAEIFNKHRYDWNNIVSINEIEFNFYQNGEDLK